MQSRNNVRENAKGLAACPICHERMQEEAVFLHLDTHDEHAANNGSSPARERRSPSFEMVSGPVANTKHPGRLPQINYALMKDNALRKKLLDLGIPNTGPRALLIRRHAEWVNIVNANVDSLRPKSKRDMLRELEVWDRSAGRSLINGSTDTSNPGSIMSKDFDGAAWGINHKVDFQDLVLKAKNNRKGTVGLGTELDADQFSRQRMEEAPEISSCLAPTTNATINSIPEQ
ncbi:MAG: hypothetical protein Q9219_007219 [cf. Caloplaca sp. 3 TL-2023]